MADDVATEVATVITPEAVASFLSRCTRAPQRFLYPCNAKDRAPQNCCYSFRRADGAIARVIICECEYTEGGTGWRVWPCALLLCCWLAMHEDVLRGTSVLELGCGLGLPGQAAAALGASSAAVSDCLPQLLATCR